jgi:hypothetical protein
VALVARNTGLPWQTGLGDTVAVNADGKWFTTSAVVTAKAVPQAAVVAVSVYTVLSVSAVEVMLAVPVTDVLFTIVLVPPVHKNDAPVAPVVVALSSIGLPAHAGFGLTVAVNVVGN